MTKVARKLLKQASISSLSLAAIATGTTLSTNCSFASGDFSLLQYTSTIEPISPQQDLTNRYFNSSGESLRWEDYGEFWTNSDSERSLNNYVADIISDSSNEILINDIMCYYSVTIQSAQFRQDMQINNCKLKISNVLVSSNARISFDVEIDLDLSISSSPAPYSDERSIIPTIAASRLTQQVRGTIKYRNLNILNNSWNEGTDWGWPTDFIIYLGVNDIRDSEWSIDMDLSFFPSANGVTGTVKQKFDKNNTKHTNLWTGTNIDIQNKAPLWYSPDARSNANMLFIGSYWQSFYLYNFTMTYSFPTSRL